VPRERSTAVVTGASGDIGLAVCERLLREGFRVFAQYHSRNERLRELRDSLAALEPELHDVRADLTEEAGVKTLFDAVRERTSKLELLVNNAGGARPTPLAELSLDEWNQCLALNVTAPFLCVREARELLRSAGGIAINISSVVAFTGGAFGPHYATAKAAVVGLTRGLARELGREGIRVNAIAPGPVVSTMTSSLPGPALAGILATTALGRCVETEEIAAVVVSLTTGCPAVTGQTLVVDGGRVFH